ncbi:hypothetical protein C8R44DRAFT_871026 [Mycena epipterygia]|nr:hypothetical protein C8R44DRAFT_871026 [Mycena epipterygia]
MSSIVIPNGSPPPTDNRPLPASYDEVQFLSRQHFHHPHVPAITLASDDPVAAIEAAVLHHWAKIDADGTVAVSPTFSAAPQSEYYGSITLPNGQVLHRSVAANVFQVIKNEETNVPFTFHGHEFNFMLVTPPDPASPWSLELPYPSNAQLHAEMAAMTPIDLPCIGDPGFPVHATEQPLPMTAVRQRIQEAHAAAHAANTTEEWSTPLEEWTTMTHLVEEPVLPTVHLSSSAAKVDLGDEPTPPVIHITVNTRWTSIGMHLEEDVAARAAHTLTLTNDAFTESPPPLRNHP